MLFGKCACYKFIVWPVHVIISYCVNVKKKYSCYLKLTCVINIFVIAIWGFSRQFSYCNCCIVYQLCKYKQHVKRKHASKKPTCSECGKQFVSTASLERHMKLHASLGCEQCRKLKDLNWKIKQMMEEARTIQNHSC